MKKKKQGIVLVILCAAVIIGVFAIMTVQRKAQVEQNVELTEVQKLTTKNLEKNYPKTPREVIKYYNRILSCYYKEEYTEEELYALGDQARILMDADLLAQNERDTYFENLKEDIADYKKKSKTIGSTSVCSSNEVVYRTIDGDECAYVEASYFVNEAKKYSRTHQTYVLRKDENGNWKILAFYQTEGENRNE